MKRIRFNALYLSIIIIIVIVIVYSAVNTKSFDLKFLVDKEMSDIHVENVLLTGTLIKFPLNLYYIKGYLVIGDNTYELANFKRGGFNEQLKLNTYRLEFIDNVNEDYFNGSIFLIGDIIQRNVRDISISIDITDKNTGNTHGQVINTLTIQD
jgi:hypothetical protein